jgi:hypothetical protein
MSAGGEHGHTLAGIFYFDLPITIVITLIFHYIIREPLLDNLPAFCQSRLVLLRSFDLRSYVLKDYMIFILSAIIGSCSHILWDNFTHNGGIMVKYMAALRDYHVPLNGARYPMWYFLQNLFTIIGLLIIAVYFLRIKPVNNQVVTPSVLYWLVISAVAILIFFGRYTLGPTMKLGDAIVSIISSLMLAVVLISLLWSYLPRVRSIS